MSSGIIKTYSPKESEIKRDWFIVDANGLVLGRLASILAYRIMGKDKVTYAPHMDCGSCIVVINAHKIHMTGSKMKYKRYYRHTGYPGGIKYRTPTNILEGKNPERLVMLAVKRMLSRGPLTRQRMRRLFVYASNKHPHEAQQPAVLDVAIMNPKNKKRD